MRYALMAVGAVIVLVALVAVIGWTLPQHHRASVSRSYRATPSALFTLITDVKSFPTWRSDVRSVEQLPDEGGHRRWRESTGSGSPITYEVERMVPDQLLVGRIADRNLPFGGSWTYELAPGGADETTLTITEDGDVYNPVFRFVSRFVMGHSATITRYLDDVQKRYPPVPPRLANAPSSGSSSR